MGGRGRGAEHRHKGTTHISVRRNPPGPTHVHKTPLPEHVRHVCNGRLTPRHRAPSLKWRINQEAGWALLFLCACGEVCTRRVSSPTEASCQRKAGQISIRARKNTSPPRPALRTCIALQLFLAGAKSHSAPLPLLSLRRAQPPPRRRCPATVSPVAFRRVGELGIGTAVASAPLLQARFAQPRPPSSPA
ncbi:hypothetical protein AAFF_G00175320 [Aldrovandia affinis]|uniref:Uncharacterized protein n=1 Tax=Aldrovandia affinis TaxID=143900 RepID=A0AAD7RLM6_9TELE|nr:hypothetical protein AAFF_G00175320 [Aldrovandia affinis]